MGDMLRDIKLLEAISKLENITKRKVVLKEEAKALGAWSGKLKNVDNMLSSIYDKMSASDKKLKDTVFHNYYRFYNDGDVLKMPIKTLEKLGLDPKFSSILIDTRYIKSILKDLTTRSFKTSYRRTILSEYELAIEHCVRVVKKYLLKKYKKYINSDKRSELNYQRRKEIINDIISSDFKQGYWIKEYGKEFAIPRLITLGKEIDELNKDIRYTGELKETPEDIKKEIKLILKKDLDKSLSNIPPIKNYQRSSEVFKPKQSGSRIDDMLK